MKVNLAVQIFSRSVAKSLKFCREVLKLPEFSESEPTEEFLLVVNDIFDLLNSRSPKCSAPLRESNQQFWTTYLSSVTLRCDQQHCIQCECFATG